MVISSQSLGNNQTSCFNGHRRGVVTVTSQAGNLGFRTIPPPKWLKIKTLKMAMSGISVSHDCDRAHDRQHSKEKDIQWTMYRIEGDSKGKKTEIIVDSVKKRCFCANNAHADKLEPEDVLKATNELWLEFVETLPENDGRYAIFDFVQKTTSGAFKDSIRFISWVPEGMPVRKKMIYSSTKDTLKKKLDVPKEIFLCNKNAEDVDDAFKELMAS